MLSDWLQDVRYAVRVLRKSPLFVAVAALSLAIGIGADTAIFSLASSLLLRPVAGVSEPGRLVDVGRTQAGRGFDTTSYPNYMDLRERTRTLAGIYAYDIEPQPMSLGGSGDAERIYGQVVTANFFSVLGSRPRLGRLLKNSDDAAGSPPVAVLSDGLWRRRFNADPAMIGREIKLNGYSFTVVGVAPPGFHGTTLLRSVLWVPISTLEQATPRLRSSILRHRRNQWLMMGARLKPGVSLARVNAELNTLGATLEREYPDSNRGMNFRAVAMSQIPGRAGVVAGFVGLLMAIVGLVLLVACANLAGMLLARAAARQQEIAVRLAIGASRGRLIRQLLTETGVLFLLGGSAGLALSRLLTSALLAVLPQLPVPVMLNPVIDWRVAGFAVLLSLLAAVLCGLAPALQASATDLVTALKAGGLDNRPVRIRLRDAFVAGQVAMSLLLVIVAGLFVRALQHAAQVDPGFNQDRVDVVSLDLSLAGYTDANGEAFVRQLLARAAALPGMESITATADLPLDGTRMGMGGLKIAGLQPPPGTQSFYADANVVEPGFFRTLKLPLLRGRDFTTADTAASAHVVIVNQALAQRFWPGQDPIGRQMELVEGRQSLGRMLTIIGVAADARLMSLNEKAEPYYYLPLAQSFLPRVSLLARSADARSTGSIIPQMREIIRDMNPNLPLTEAMPLSEITAIDLAPQHIAAAVAGSLGVVSMLLAAIGIYGITAYVVSRRTREIAIRMALGATGLAVMRFVLRDALRLAAAGAILGMAAAATGSRLLENLLFGMRALDPATFAAVALLFVLLTLAASYTPAQRARKVDPMAALRSE